jgi:hypothetical protein
MPAYKLLQQPVLHDLLVSTVSAGPFSNLGLLKLDVCHRLAVDERGSGLRLG